MVHKAVLLGEAIENLDIKPGDTVIDATLGAGGHSMEILKKILPGGMLISIDWDKRAVENFESILKKDQAWGCPAPTNNNKNSEKIFPNKKKLGNRRENIAECWCGVADNYANLKQIIRGLGVKTADAVLVDLGFSSDQIEDPKRGFSFSKNGLLDMRYSHETQELTAADVINEYSEKGLVDIFQKYGEERFARRIAKAIIRERRAGRINETQQLAAIVSQAVPEKYRRGKIYPVKSHRAGAPLAQFNRVNPATRIFQALRIEVNQELENLKKFLEEAADVLASGGRLAAISFHSLEDRIVKQFFQKESRDCVCPPNFPKCICSHKARLRIITKKPIVPEYREIRENPRARSAKLRVAEKM
jgi:16S rRNA (cytosine1402-N4)-methyltransferase